MQCTRTQTVHRYTQTDQFNSQSTWAAFSHSYSVATSQLTDPVDNRHRCLCSPWTNNRLSTESVLSWAQRSSIVWPVTENTLSEEVSVAGIARRTLATDDNFGHTTDLSPEGQDVRRGDRAHQVGIQFIVLLCLISSSQQATEEVVYISSL